jgi:ABC-type multidrug transport system fused ATPase/permease subunit
VRNADFLVVLDRGRVIESGSHAELVSRNGLYARLIRRQLGGLREAVAADGE